MQTAIINDIIDMTKEKNRRITLYRRRRYRHRNPKLKRLAMIGIAAAVVIGAFLSLLGFVKHSNEEHTSSDIDITQEQEETSSDAETLPVTDTAEPEKITLVSGEVTTEDKVKLPDEIKQLLIDYTADKYEYTGELEYKSLSGYFNADKTYGKLYAGFCDTSLQYLIYARQCRSADLSYDEASFVINVEKASVKSGVYTVNYTVSEKIMFATSDTPAKSCGMEIEAQISKGTDGKYKFDILAEDTDVNLLIEKRVMDYLGYDYEEYYLKDMKIPDTLDCDKMYAGILKSLKADAGTDITGQEKMLADYNADPDSFKTSKTAKHEYDRDRAVAYSYKWVDGEKVIRNPDYSDYAIYGGNCQNYVSQSLYAAGIPMEWSGNEQWKWFDDEGDLSESPTGRSGSWSGTEYFYEYCNKNTGKGLVAETDGNIFSAQPGDVIQYVVDGWAHHSVIVSKVIYDDNGNVIDLLINSNTTDRVDYPMSAYGYTNIRLIKIIGYNDK